MESTPLPGPLTLVEPLDGELLQVGRVVERLQVVLLAVVAVGVGILVVRGRG